MVSEICGESDAVCVVAVRNGVHCLAHLVGVDERTDEDQAAEHEPEPEGGGAEIRGKAAGARFAAEALGHLVIPDERKDAAGDRAEQEENEAVVHGFLPVAAHGGDIQVLADAGPENDRINAAGNDAENDVLPERALIVHDLERHGRRCRLLIRCVVHEICLPFTMKIRRPPIPQRRSRMTVK